MEEKKVEEKKDLSSDFVDETPVEIKIEGRIFKYKPVTAGEENDWLNQTLIIDLETETARTNWARYNELKFLNIKSVPYTEEQIFKLVGVKGEWTSLNDGTRLKLFKKLKPSIFTKLTKAIKKIDEPESEQKKN